MTYQTYADHHITARPKPLIEAVPVDHAARKQTDGWWQHPGMPELEEGQCKLFEEWLREQQLELCERWMQSEDTPEIEAYFDNDETDFSFWQPIPPAAGWFLLCINDTEDGPVAVFARRVTQYPAPDVESDGGEP